jgi:phage shock protein PspC (stress-responsive transcriptional regulator)
MSDPPRKRLLRSTDDRILAGVAGGIANYLDIDPTLVRVGFVAAVLFGGLGIVAYLVLAVVTPNDDGSGAPVQGDRPSLGLVALAVLAVLVLLPGPFWGPFDWGIGWWWGGSLWLLLLAAGAVWLYMAVRDRGGPPPPGDGPEGEPAQPTTAVTEPLDRTSAAPPARGDRANRLLRAIAIGVLIFAALIVAAAVAGVSAWATATGNGEIVAGIVVALGVALVGAAFVGEPRWRWLILPALVLALPAGGIAAADIRFDGGIGDRDHRPTAFGAIPDDGYSLGVGDQTIDLRGLPWHPRDRVELETDMGIGETIVSVPSDVCVESDARARVGEVYIRGQRSSGVDPEVNEVPPASRAPRLVLDSEVDIGSLKVSDRPPSELRRGDHAAFGRGADGRDSEDEAERAEAKKACER